MTEIAVASHRGVGLQVKRIRLGSLLLVALSIWVASAVAQTGRVRVVLFFSLTCPHCHDVIQKHLPMLFETRGGVPETQLAWGTPEEEIAVYYVANSQIELLLVDVASPVGSDLFAASTEAFSIPNERLGVPRLVIGDTVLVGSLEIPTHLPGMVDEGVTAGGMDWPAIPGLRSVVAGIVGETQRLAEATAEDSVPEVEEPSGLTEADVTGDTVAAPPETQPVSEPQPEPDPADPEPGPELADPELADPEPDPEPADPASEPELAAASPAADHTAMVMTADTSASDTSGVEGESEPSIFDRLPERRASPMENFRNDPLGNAVSVIVLIGMVLCVVAVIGLPRFRSAREALSPLVLGLAIVGLAVAAYLAYVEATGSLAVCGPVGDCNTVQQSPYARLFGLIPVGVVGALGYVVIGIAWVISRFQAQHLRDMANVTVFSFSFVGTLFSIYLTFLEPFVIGATCAWCLTSSIIITALMALSAGPGLRAWMRLRRSDFVPV